MGEFPLVIFVVDLDHGSSVLLSWFVTAVK